MVRRPPAEVRTALKALARAVKVTGEVYEAPSPDPLSLYHAREYLTEMEDLLVQQVLTAFHDTSSGADFLSSCGLDYLTATLEAVAEQWNNPEP